MSKKASVHTLEITFKNGDKLRQYFADWGVMRSVAQKASAMPTVLSVTDSGYTGFKVELFEEAAVETIEAFAPR